METLDIFLGMYGTFVQIDFAARRNVRLRIIAAASEESRSNSRHFSLDVEAGQTAKMFNFLC